MSSRKYHPLLAVMALGGLALAPAHAAADDAGGRQVIVARGNGAVHVRPDSVHVDMGVEVQAATLDAAKSRASVTMQSVLDAVRALGLPDLAIQTLQIRFSPVYAPPRDNSPPSIVGYSASNHVLVTSKHAPEAELAARAVRLVDTALAAGADNVGGIDFFLDDPSQAEQEAITLAVQNAQRDAQTMASAANVTLLGLVSIEEASASRAPRAFTLEAATVATPIEIGDITIGSEVTARFAFR